MFISRSDMFLNVNSPNHFYIKYNSPKNKPDNTNKSLSYNNESFSSLVK